MAGKLECTIQYAKDLKDKGWFGKQDPYAILAIGHLEFRTKTHKGGGTQPVWDETFSFNVDEESQLSVTIFDQGFGKSDDLVGRAMVSLATARARGWDQLQQPLLRPSNKEKGFVSLSLKFTRAGGDGGSAAPVPEVPLQQAAVRAAALPGYGAFTQPYGTAFGAPQPPNSPAGGPPQGPYMAMPHFRGPQQVYGEPAVTTGHPSPYSAYFPVDRTSLDLQPRPAAHPPPSGHRLPSAGSAPVPGYPPSGYPPAYPPAAGHPLGPAYPGYPQAYGPAGDCAAEVDLAARHALPRFGSGKSSPSRRR